MLFRHLAVVWSLVAHPVCKRQSLSMSTSSTHPVILLSTVPNEEVAKSISRGLVERKLIACANIVPKVTSVYWWDGGVQEDSELLMIMKTQASLVPQVTEYVKAEHPYEIPELIATKIEGGNDAYIQWISQNTIGRT
ncbi:uncharacterized protein SPPG_08958 [Spizellomyces punctatus DAOM BR117]|uniref:CutA1 divalent ion tolerance protein n=1 Tax=Spizellomyces punctatus (strain DAOM BR117) TaxID=645134 RepID=A0A0L0HMN9_SPIPD|nr:uncharacterized protein SPPG_08958 [Spizellomyces punctatus DAOM BR117]KND02691.1 hypothetical protein SPPG_08958 [Spizellomyces punctatus DAOM BR117]|eukprot:XP_016610730.1 hypothetical protein SPPG_08958 [Spizellomyces punctatus DAOM BR117]